MIYFLSSSRTAESLQSNNFVGISARWIAFRLTFVSPRFKNGSSSIIVEGSLFKKDEWPPNLTWPKSSRSTTLQGAMLEPCWGGSLQNQPTRLNLQDCAGGNLERLTTSGYHRPRCASVPEEATGYHSSLMVVTLNTYSNRNPVASTNGPFQGQKNS